MYNFNQTSLSTPPMLGVGMDFCSGTPRTPEILNSLIAMTNPFEYSYASSLASQQSHAIPMSMSMSPTLLDSSPVIECKMENSYLQFDNNSQSNCSSSSSLESPSTTPFHLSSSMLSTTNTTSSTPSLQQTRSQLIKAGVKLLIQSKRKNSGSSSCDADCKPPPLKIRATSVSSPTSFSSSSQRNDFIPIASNDVPSSASSLTSPKQLTSPMSSLSFPLKSDCNSNSSCDEDYDTKPLKAGRQFLTPEDEDRRKRRRERNKIAATKCRLKKRECINNLMRESEVLEAQNVDLKTQMKSLEEEFKYLKEMWQAHQNECKNMSLLGNNGSRENHHHQHHQQHQQQQQHHHQNNLCLNNNNNSNNHNGNLGLIMPDLDTLKDTNNNKHLNNLDLQLPSLTPLINCNVSFDFY